MSKFAASLAVAAVLLSASAIAETAKPTVVLVHGAFADSSSWNGVTRILQKDGYNVVAAANPLRSVSGDAAYVSSVVNNIKGTVVLVGHSYGGQVITNAARDTNNVKSLVYVAAFAPDAGEAAADLAGKFPGGTLGQALATPVKLADGSVDRSAAQIRTLSVRICTIMRDTHRQLNALTQALRCFHKHCNLRLFNIAQSLQCVQQP